MNSLDSEQQGEMSQLKLDLAIIFAFFMQVAGIASQILGVSFMLKPQHQMLDASCGSSVGFFGSNVTSFDRPRIRLS